MRTRVLVLRLGPLVVALVALALAIIEARDSLPLAAQATDRLTAEVTPAGCGTVAAQLTSDTSTPTTGTEWTFPRGAYVRAVATASPGCSFVRFDLGIDGSVVFPSTSNPFQFQLFSGLTTTVRANFSGTPTSTPTPQNHTLTTSAGANGSVDPAAGDHTYASGTSVTITATPDTGYRIASWGDDCSGDDLTCVLTMDADKTASVTFELDQYTLTTSGGENGSVDPAAGDNAYANGTSVTVTATPDEGYRVAAWGGDCSGDGLTCVLTMDADKTASVTFEEDNYTLTTSAGENGAIAPAAGAHAYASGTSVTVTATPDEGYRVAEWGGDCSGGELTCALTMDADKTASVTFEVDTGTLTLTTAAGANGSVDPAPGVHTYAKGTAVTVTAIPDGGFGVASWGGDCSGTGLSCTLVMSANRTAIVTFVRTSYALTASVIGEGSVSPGGATTHAVNAAVTLTASWNATTHSFGGWGGHCTGSATTCTLTMDADKVVTASFTSVCANGTAVPNPTANFGLVNDCERLLLLEDTLAGTATTLNWDAGTAITSWTGVTVGGSPQRITRLSLASLGLTGELSGLLGSLTGLTQLQLNGNSLTGRIPSRIEQLTRLTHVFLRGNSLSGCVPLVLRTVANNDVTTLGLPDCPAPTDISYGEHTLTAGTYKFLLHPGGAPVVFDVPVGLRLEIVGMVQSDAAGGGSYLGMILREVAGRSWICVDVERSEECGRRVVAGGAGGASGASGHSSGANTGSRFDRISESLWTDSSP